MRQRCMVEGRFDNASPGRQVTLNVPVLCAVRSTLPEIYNRSV
jgi:hypothetical protein